MVAIKLITALFSAVVVFAAPMPQFPGAAGESSSTSTSTATATATATSSSSSSGLPGAGSTTSDDGYDPNCYMCGPGRPGWKRDTTIAVKAEETTTADGGYAVAGYYPPGRAPVWKREE